MQSFVASLLTHEGALVEPIEPEGLEVLAPAPVQAALGVGEFLRLGFGATLPAGAQRVGIEADWIDRFARLVGERGRWMQLVLGARGRAPGDPETLLAKELVLDNATFRLLGVTPAWTRYLVLDFRATAVSDEKRDFMLRLGVNLATGALADGLVTALDFREANAGAELPDDIALPPRWERARLLEVIRRAVPGRLDVALGPFITGLRRRLERDQDRLHQYHDDLHQEAMRRAVALAEGDPKRQREEQRAEAIGREYRAKLDDLSRQYATQVTVEWVQTLELVMPVHRFEVQVRRRKADRVIWLDWNPVARRLEGPPCEYGYGMERPRLVCDEALHLVAAAGMQACMGCGRAFCRVCHPAMCPKCRLAAKTDETG